MQEYQTAFRILIRLTGYIVTLTGVLVLVLSVLIFTFGIDSLGQLSVLVAVIVLVIGFALALGGVGLVLFTHLSPRGSPSGQN